MSDTAMAPDTRKGLFDTDTEYHSLSNREATPDPAKKTGKRSWSLPAPRSKTRAWIWTIALQLFAALWLVPIIALLVLNGTSYVIGPTAWCPSRKCYVNLFNHDLRVPAHNAARFAKNDRNLVATLQLVAKALEVWFEFIAASLMYLLLVQIASSPEGISVGYMTQHVQFTDLLRDINPRLWQALPSWRSKCVPYRRVVSIWGVMILSLVLGVLCNLMGPATAVLVIPNLVSYQTPFIGDQYMYEMNSAQPPGPASISALLTSCSQQDFTHKKWSCTTSQLDNVAAGSLYKVLPGLGSDESDGPADCSFAAINDTRRLPTDARWVPNALTMTDMATDLYAISLLSQNKYIVATVDESVSAWSNHLNKTLDSFAVYNRSLSVDLHRTGPILGAYSSLWTSKRGRSWITDVTKDKQIRCYPNYHASTMVWEDPRNSFTRCIQTGSGWGPNTKQETFNITIDGSEVTSNSQVGAEGPPKFSTKFNQTQTELSTVQVNVFTSDRSVLLQDGQLPAGMPTQCLTQNGQIPSETASSCNWEVFFDSTPSFFTNLTHYPVTIEYIHNTRESETRLEGTFVTDFNAYLGFTNYTMDVAPANNPLRLVQARELSTNGAPVAIDPNWILAMWSADANGTISTARDATASVMDLFKEDPEGYLSGTGFLPSNSTPAILDLLPIYTIASLEYEKRTEPSKTLPSLRLQRRTILSVWAYGIDSRTSYLGAVVAIAGCAVVILQIILGFMDQRERRSLWQLLIAALEHKPHDEFVGLNGNNKLEVSRVRFRLEEDESVGKFQFLRPNDESDGLRQRASSRQYFA